jgi:hypothetical protein
MENQIDGGRSRMAASLGRPSILFAMRQGAGPQAALATDTGWRRRVAAPGAKRRGRGQRKDDKKETGLVDAYPEILE